MNGKNRCKILKDIRRQIAESNDIAFVTSECKYQGDCKGTCPKCESEVRYLERELEKRRRMGLSVTLAGLATAVTVSSTGCALLASEVDGMMADDYPRMEETEVQFDGVMVPMPEIQRLLGMTAEEMTDYLKVETATGLRSVWKSYWIETQEENTDVYRFEQSNQEYTVYITFDESDSIALVMLFADEETQISDTTDTREIAETLMGDIAE